MKVIENMPLPNKLVLVTGKTHFGPALAWVSTTPMWHVFPALDQWYTTEKGITDWFELPEEMVETLKEDGYYITEGGK